MRDRQHAVAESDPDPVLFDPLPVGTRLKDEWHTPRWLFDRFGVIFDVDVAAPVDGPRHVPCRAYFTATDDGLAQRWSGLVWCNPPYSNVAPFARRCLQHGHGLLLAPLSPRSAWCSEVLDAADAVVPLPQIQFERTAGSTRHVSWGVILYAFGVEAVGACARLSVPAFARMRP